MKYVAFIIWLLITGAMCLTILPAIIAYEATTWFELGRDILDS